MNKEGMPKSFTDMIGKEFIFKGGVFGRKEIEETEFTVLDCRWGSGIIYDMKEMKEKHPTVELLVKREGMRASRWTRGFPCIEIKLDYE